MDANGYPIPGVSFTWTSSNPTVASIDATGLATGLSVGTATITASAGGVTSNGDQLVTSGGTTYTTDFPLTENPISEGGNWINGKVVGLDWSDVQTSGGEAYGTQPNHTTPPPYNDSIAILTGNWPADQKVQATVKIAQSNPAAFQEVEFWLRFTLTANSALGYGIAFRTTNDGSQYLDIGPMLGPINAFGGGVHLTAADGYAGIKDGDILAAQIVANVITVFVNGVLVAQWTDSQFATGNPGIGFWLRGDYVNGPSDYGFSNFTASGVSGT
jgi:hypothetical protein